MRTIERKVTKEEAVLALMTGSTIRYHDCPWPDVELKLMDSRVHYRDYPTNDWCPTQRLEKRFVDGSNWRILEEAATEWYDNLEETGPVLCYCWDGEHEHRTLHLVADYQYSTILYPYITSKGTPYAHAEPVDYLTIEQYFLENK